MSVHSALTLAAMRLGEMRQKSCVCPAHHWPLSSLMGACICKNLDQVSLHKGPVHCRSRHWRRQLAGLYLPLKAVENVALGLCHGYGLLSANLVVEAQQVQDAVHQQYTALVLQGVPAEGGCS